ncbi:unnamed protein product [Moneuplotes crassus]|uniref:Uncharacterized protein n=1 Tax=Euplotes crassus TaxID=5936 RepID=A0AAD1UU39_EUPCR|nr:unnamed protein product [Moneuplotes crassus]
MDERLKGLKMSVLKGRGGVDCLEHSLESRRSESEEEKEASLVRNSKEMSKVISSKHTKEIMSLINEATNYFQKGSDFHHINNQNHQSLNTYTIPESNKYSGNESKYNCRARLYTPLNRVDLIKPASIKNKRKFKKRSSKCRKRPTTSSIYQIFKKDSAFKNYKRFSKLSQQRQLKSHSYVKDNLTYSSSDFKTENKSLLGNYKFTSFNENFKSLNRSKVRNKARDQTKSVEKGNIQELHTDSKQKFDKDIDHFQEYLKQNEDDFDINQDEVKTQGKNEELETDPSQLIPARSRLLVQSTKRLRPKTAMRSVKREPMHGNKMLIKSKRKNTKRLRKAYLGSSRKVTLKQICHRDKELVKMIKNMKLDRVRRMKKKLIRL